MSLMNTEAVEAHTQSLLDRGIRIFNAALFAPTERDHVEVLLQLAALPADAMVIDAGCGVGEMAVHMLTLRPDLEILLVNTSMAQLRECPADFERLHTDFDHLAAVPDGSADAIIFSYSICHSPDWRVTLREARRVLRDGGVLLINDLARLAGDNGEFERLLGARAHEPEWVEEWAAGAGFRLDVALAPEVHEDRLGEVLAADGVDTEVLEGLVPTVWRFIAVPVDEARRTCWVRHRGHIGFQFSGGRDSTAALYLLRDRWAEMTVYHLDTGDQFPETQEVVRRVRADVEAAGGRFEVIETDVRARREAVGYPSDLVPVDNTTFGRLVSGESLRITSRYECCAGALMDPMHERMVADGITLLVRGQRDDEYARPPMRSGDVADGFEVFYPLQDWTADQVQAFLEERGLPVAPFYRAGMRRAPECMGCTAWWDEGRADYLRVHHPQEHAVLLQRLADIRAAVGRSMAWLNHETEN